ncbi:MAG: protein kinase [Candidatus Promineofilum sp.]|nr:protein kinase [Promineifilum sp.]MCW5865216.1 protein kinase [Anaerolineae bacterium]
MTNLINQTLNNRYRLEALLGDGGMGTVYRAADLNLERQVAIKLMHSHFARLEEFRARLVQEARTAAQLDHPSIVRVYDFGDSELGLFIAMEYVDGGSLRDHLRRLQRLQKYLPLAQCLQIGIQMAEALDYAHRRKIIHRDVKPGNIILKRLSRPDEAGAQPFRALLTDFGLVKLQEGLSLTQSGATVGTPTYMSPEQCEGRELDGRSDLYSLGVVLYELVANKLPFTFQTLSEAIAAHQNNVQPALASTSRPEVPPIIDTLLARSMAKSPAQRFATGAEMADALRSAFVALEGLPTRVMLHQELDILDQVAEPPVGFELQIQTPGHGDSLVPLTRAVITLGRNLDNDIVLPADGVSRHHTRLQATSLGWEVVDLGGVNGTWLNEHRLRPEEPTPLPVGSVLKIGPYEMILQGPDAPVPVEADKGMPISAPITPGLVAGPATAATRAAASSPGYASSPGATAEQPTSPPSRPPAPLAVHMARDKITVEPGQRVEVKVDVENRGDQEDRVTLSVQGIDPAWVDVPEEFTVVPPRQTVAIPFAIHPPRQRGTPAGRQRLRIDLKSQRYPDTRVGATAALTVGPFVAFEASMNPTEVRLPGRTVVTIHNTGNALAAFNVNGSDLQQFIRFRGAREGIALQPNQTANVELVLEMRETNLFGEADVYPFEVEVAAGPTVRQVLPGEAIARSIIPTPWLYVLLFLIIFGGVLGGLALVSNWGRFLGIGGVPTSTPTISFEQQGVTQTAAAAVLTIAVATQSGAATNVALTAAVEGDTDQDGLTNTQEGPLGLDLNNPDSDADGLKDGDEVLIYMTDPKVRDSDNDLLTDFDEVNTYKTNPRASDTDGDGVPDALEVGQGTDPLVPNPPTVTPVTPSPTTPPPSVTWTPIPSITPTWTPIPSVTATWTPIPSATATWTPIPTLTPTATSTPPLLPGLTCAPGPINIDGVLNVGTEWPATPTFSFQPTVSGASRLVNVFAVRDAGRLYLGFLINDAANEPTDSVRVYIDTTNNGGDGDTSDRFFQVARDGSRLLWAGIGSNADGQEWNSNYTSNNWTAAVGEPGNGQWVVEMQIDAVAELGALGDPFGLMAQVLYTGDLASYPSTASSSQANTWQDIANVLCP